MKQKILRRFLYAKECLILTLAVLSLIFLAFDQFGNLSASQLHYLYQFDIIVGLIFIGELLLELWLATNKSSYVKHNWFYLFAAIPLPSAWAQLLRSIRIIRVIKLIRLGTHFEYEKGVNNYKPRTKRL